MTAAWADPDLGLLVWLAMVTGARSGELCALPWRHLEPTRHRLVIEAAMAQDGASPQPPTAPATVNPPR